MLSYIYISLVLMLSFTSDSTHLFSASKIDFLLNEFNNPESNYIMVTAHRGDWHWAPENSLQGFQNCIEAGIDIIEIDVRLTKDSIPVVIHDLTVDRTTNGTGTVSEFTLDSIKKLRLRQTDGGITNETIPTLEEVMTLAKDKISIYLDKSHDKIKYILPVLEKTGTLNQSIFVLDYGVNKAEKIFAEYLNKVLYVPVVDNQIPDLELYLKEHLQNNNFHCFQLRIDEPDSPAHEAMKLLRERKAKLFVAATWPTHTMQHDDLVSRKYPDNGWGWLIDQGFTILETNYPYQLLEYLKINGLRD